MSTPIIDFVKKYSESGTARFHMPGHKGRIFHGLEPLDITEIKGADYLFEADGVIARSEEQTAKAFGAAKTLYSTQGSTLCIKTMLALAKFAKGGNEKFTVAAPRNVHKAFIDACILLDINVKWLYPKGEFTSLCAGEITAEEVRESAAQNDIDCVYVTSPTYLGAISDINDISKVCRENNIPLLCDNAHGAYLNFLEENLHPIKLGADMCCDSAHKTLPCYTGGAYLHISPNAPGEFVQKAKAVMSMFASTSPSYLIMQSLDLCSDHISSGKFREDLKEAVKRTALAKSRISGYGWTLYGDEPLKITVDAAMSGASGNELAEKLREYGIEPEYADSRYLVLMVSPFNSEEDIKKAEMAFRSIPQGEKIMSISEHIPKAKVRMGIRQAAFSASHMVETDKALGRICALTVTSCQPSVPVAVSGEEITEEVIKILKRYGISHVNVI